MNRIISIFFNKSVLVPILLLFSAVTVFAHPSPDDFPGIPRQQLGLTLAILCLGITGFLYVWAGLKRSSRAQTVKEYFFYDKKVKPIQYFDTTVGYSFQVVVTVYFIYWGFKYGVGVLYYALTWLIGFWLFQKCSKKLVPFAQSEHTLHSFLADRYGTSLTIRKLTAFCTLFGLIGAMLIEVSYTTDLLTGLTNVPVSTAAWIFIYVAILLLTCLFVQIGGYKSTVITDVQQLPITYAALSILVALLNWITFEAGNYAQGVKIGVMCCLMWLVVVIARSHRRLKEAFRDKATLVAIFALCVSAATVIACGIKYINIPSAHDPIPDLPDAFTLDGLWQQGIWTLLGFTILNFAWQFFDMTAWQRISSLDLSGLSEENRAQHLSRVIGETKWESPITWIIGIVIGIALHYSGLFHHAKDADDAFNGFVKIVFDNDLPGPLGMLLTYIGLPALLVGFFGVMITTVNSFLITSTFTWARDISSSDKKTTLNESVAESVTLRHVRRAALSLTAAGCVIFIISTKILNVNIFLFLNTIYSAQFAITFFTVGALFLRNPKKSRTIVLSAVIGSLVANYATAGYCYWKMIKAPDSAWPEYFYVLPTILSAAFGIAILGVMSVIALLVTAVRRNAKGDA